MLFGVDERFLSMVLLVDAVFCKLLILYAMEFLPSSCPDGTTDPCNTRSDSGCFDLQYG